MNLIKDSRVNITKANKDGRTVLHYAAELGWYDVIRDVLVREKSIADKPDASKTTPLFLASAGGREECVYILLGHGAATNRSYGKGNLPFIAAAVLGGITRVVHLLHSKPETNVDAQDPEGMTALHFACDTGNDAMVKMLVEEGKADIHLKSNSKRSPLSYASKSGAATVVQFLRSRLELWSTKLPFHMLPPES
ncbi:ankyrin repeat-containing domain protein [Lasiosphaeris hirsuta]|uniref:Ankyrin repeat-containing domain protein n=1 Tax=Lasiosphaeris hirsuta TaxID=260670 RepID=A0AA40BCZ0_9PEZI|nr:ankyrin repeat-containing domain protein [Lasiosphaeris hirsuta]